MTILETCFLEEKLKTPIALTSGAGPLGYLSLNQNPINLEAISLMAIKGITLKPQKGNFEPRIIKINDSIINAIGLDNGGFQEFRKKTLPKIKQFSQIVTIVNINGSSINEYISLAKKLNEIDHIKIIEINISCPNKKDGLLFCHDLKLTEKLLKKIRTVLTKKKMIVKLSIISNVKKLAVVCQKSGADAISLINSIPATVINIATWKPGLGFKIGGLSGKAIKPMALAAVYQVYQVVTIPIIGIGGITSFEDAIEFLLAGASIISIGAGLFNNPNLPNEIKNGLIKYCKTHNLKNINEIIGKAHEQ